jgi:hypothetical protein
MLESPEKSKKTRKKIKRSSSTSTIYLTSTMNSPHSKNLISSISTIILSQIVEDEQLGKVISPKSDLFYFSEEKYLTDNDNDDRQDRLESKLPTVDDISSFIEALFNCAQFSVECCVLCLIYINRIITLTGFSINPSNWRPLVLVSLMVAQKVWDDRYLCNADFAYIYPFFDNSQLNLLEIKFLEIIQYNVYVKSSLYIKYYIELRSLFPIEELNDKPLCYQDICNMENTDINYIYSNENKDEEKDEKESVYKSLMKNKSKLTEEDLEMVRRINKMERSKSLGRNLTEKRNSYFIIS